MYNVIINLLEQQVSSFSNFPAHHLLD
jgi:hypothetical protein